MRGAVGALDDVAVDQAAGAEERGHAGGDALRERGVRQTLEDFLPREIRIGAFVKGEAHVGEPVERDGAHDHQVRGAVHGQLERQRGEALDFLGGVAGPLGDEFHHGRRKVGIGVHRHAAEGNRAGDDDEHREHQHDEALLQRKLDDAMDHRRETFRRDARRSEASCRVARKGLLVLQGILELQEEAAVADDALAFL